MTTERMFFDCQKEFQEKIDRSNRRHKRHEDEKAVRSYQRTGEVVLFPWMAVHKHARYLGHNIRAPLAGDVDRTLAALSRNDEPFKFRESPIS